VVINGAVGGDIIAGEFPIVLDFYDDIAIF